MERVPAPAKAVSRHRQTPIPRGDWLRPTFLHKIAMKGGEGVCRTQAGRPRAYHASMPDGFCLFCGEYNPSMDLPMGRKQ